VRRERFPRPLSIINLFTRTKGILTLETEVDPQPAAVPQSSGVLLIAF